MDRKFRSRSVILVHKARVPNLQLLETASLRESLCVTRAWLSRDNCGSRGTVALKMKVAVISLLCR